MDKDNFQGKYYDYLIEEYKLFVEMTDRVSQRRANTNQFYTSILSGLLAIAAFVVDKNDLKGYISIVFALIGLLGIILCIIWRLNIKSYRQLNSAKFKIIHEMESKLPFACYENEWQLLGKGIEGKKYKQLTIIENYVPFIVLIPYFLLFIFSLYLFFH
jgi:hypothetical protein